jgi:phospholipid/cholesterol/gamma-HCH transport system substrate-binding protein
MNVKNEIAVGILFTVAMIILGYFTIMVEHEIFEPEDYYYITVVFSSVEGLEEKDNVNVNGVRSGQVDRITLEHEYVKVRLKMYVRFPMYENYRIRIANESALGGKLVAIYPGEQMVRNVAYAEIKGRENLKGISSEDIFASISSLVEENRSDIRATIQNIREITGKINRGGGTIGQLINENKMGESANDLIVDLREAVEDSREQAPVTSFIRAGLLAF